MIQSRDETSPRPEVQAMRQLNGTVEEQNQRYAGSDVLESSRLRQIVKLGIGEEQLDSFQELLETAAVIPYAELGNAALEHARLTAEMASIEVQLGNDPDKLKLDAQVAKALELSPRKAEAIIEYSQDRTDALLEAKRQTITKELGAHSQSVEAEFLQYGEPWVIPQAISPADRLTLFQLVAESTDPGVLVDVQDIIPVTPEERRHQASVADRAKYEVENADASNYITYYLQQQMGKVVTVDELIRFLYVADLESRDKTQYRTRVTTLLGPQTQGKRIQGYLADRHGLKLQYGLRTLKINENGKWVTKSQTRIYRAVQATASSAAVNTEQVTPRLPESAKVLDQWEEITVEEPTVIDATPTVETLTVVQEVVDAKTDESIVKNAERDGWKLALKADVERVIIELAADELLDDDAIRGSVVRSLSSKGTLGTKTNRERMYEAGLMNASEVKADQMTLMQRVVGSLFNTHSHVLGKGRKQKAALTIVKETVDQRNAILELASKQ